MTIGSFLLKIVLFLSPACLVMSAKSEYRLDLSAGTFPKGVVTENVNGVMPETSAYKNGWTDKGWIPDRFGTVGYVACCPTYTGTGLAGDRRLTLPQIAVDKGEWLSWKACSLLPEICESYRVELLEEGAAEPEVLLQVDAENRRWTPRMVPLDEYAGKKVTITFVCTSEDKYMLLLADVSAGEPVDLQFDVSDKTARYNAAGPDTMVTLEALNIGKPAECAAVVCRVGGEVVSRIDMEETWETYTRRTLTLPAPTDMDVRTEYSVSLILSGGEEKVLSEGSYYSSAFVRNLLVDKGTGMWCNNCPAGNLTLERLEDKYGGNLLALETHCGNDILANDDMLSALEFYAVPQFMLNRIRGSQSSSDKEFSQYYDSRTSMAVQIDKVELTDGDNVNLSASVQTADEVDNSDGHLRLAYVMTADFHNDGTTDEERSRWYQLNSMTQPSGERYYFLPNKILNRFLYFNNVTLTYDNAFGGVEGSIPSTLVPGGKYEFSWSMERPDMLDDLRQGYVTAYIVDTTTGIVQNAARVSLAEDFDHSGVDTFRADGAGNVNLRHEGNGTFTLSGCDGLKYTLSVYAVSGSCVGSCSGVACSGDAVSLPLEKGIYVARLDTAAGSVTVKVVAF